MRKNWKKLLGSFLALAMMLTMFCGISFANDGQPVLLFDKENYKVLAGDKVPVKLTATTPDASNQPVAGLQVFFKLADKNTDPEDTERETWEELPDATTDAKGVIEFNLPIGTDFPYTLYAYTEGKGSERDIVITEGQPEPDPKPDPEPTEKITPSLTFNLDSYSTTTEDCELNGILSENADGNKGIANAEIKWEALDPAGESQSGSCTTDGNGFFNFTIKTQMGMSYAVTISYAGNDKYNSATGTTTAVNEAKPDKQQITLKFEEDVYEAKEGDQLVTGVYVLDNDGNPVADVTVEFKIAGSDGTFLDLGDTTTAVTNAEGLAGVTATLGAAFPYTLTAAVAETDLVNAAEASAMITQPEKGGNYIWLIVLIAFIIIAIIVILIIVNSNKKKRAEAMKNQDNNFKE